MLRVVHDSLYSSKNRRIEHGTRQQNDRQAQTEYELSREAA